MSIEEALEQIKQRQNLSVENVFTPNNPSTANFFCGREKEAISIISGIVESNSNLLVYGDRGIGKTSLAKYSCGILSNRFSVSNHYYICGEESTFGTVMASYFNVLGIESSDKITTTRKGEGGVDFKVAKIGATGERMTEIVVEKRFDDVSWVASKLKDCPGFIMLIDEFDKIADAKEKGKFASLMKLLSDYQCPIKLIVVGVAHNVGELMEGHESVVRCLREVQVPRMLPEELQEIIERGENRLGIRFDQDVKGTIVRESAGFPYFTHLLALETVKTVMAEGRKNVTMEDFQKGVEAAVNDQNNTLQKKIIDVLSVKNEMVQRNLLLAASAMDDLEFTSPQWRAKYKDITGETIEQGRVNALMEKAIKDDYSSVFHRVKEGRYIFVDPRMQVYIKLKYGNNQQD